MVPINPGEYGIGLIRGFLPEHEPLEYSNRGDQSVFEPLFELEEIAQTLPQRLTAGGIRGELKNAGSKLLEHKDYTELMSVIRRDQQLLRQTMRLFSFLGHAYVWGSPGEDPVEILPSGLAVPWHGIATELGRPPVLSYESYALDNWKRIIPYHLIGLDNIMLQQNFFGGLDENWFIFIHIAIESAAGPIPNLIVQALHAHSRNNHVGLESLLLHIAGCQDKIFKILSRQGEKCDPYMYYNRVRPHIHGWYDNPALPNGLIYEGVLEYGGKPQFFRGETGAQSAIVPMLDAFLGVQHKKDKMWYYLQEMRTYMPPGHKAFIEKIEEVNGYTSRNRGNIRRYVKQRKITNPSLHDAYVKCVDSLAQFRGFHRKLAHDFIEVQHQMAEQNPTAVGTGGTPLGPYLSKHHTDTVATAQ